jgi:hypothetical protein
MAGGENQQAGKPPVNIRQAHSVHDIDKIAFGAGEFVKLVDRPDLFPDASSPELIAVINKLLWVPSFSVLLAEDGGRLVGGIGFIVSPYVMSVGKIEWQEIFWWCAEDAPAGAAMALLRAAKKAGADAGATVFTAHRLMTSPAGVHLAYRRLGMEPIQVTYVGVG